MEKSPAPIATKEMSLKRKASIEIPIVNNKPMGETKSEETEVLDGMPNKKIIKLSEVMTNMNPLEYFSRFLDIPEMIFRHLSGKDLIAASEVSPSYYNFTASSKVLMKNIKIVFDDKRMLETPLKHLNSKEDHSLLKNSSRIYQNIEIKRPSPKIEDGGRRKFDASITSSEFDFLYSKAHEWKNVSLRNVYLRKRLDLWRFLSAIESSVESISVKEFGALSFKDPSTEIESFEAFKFPKLKKLKSLEAFKFPKLKQLKIHHDYSPNDYLGQTLARFFQNAVDIEELAIKDFSFKVKKNIIKKMLKNSDKLKSLIIYSKILNQIFEDDSWRKFQFKLKSLTIADMWHSNFGNNFLNFLKSQSDNIEELDIKIEGVHREIFDVIMTMPKLKNLNLMYCQGFSENEVPIKISTSITELTVIWCPNPVILKFWLDSMPKVTNLELSSIDEEGFKMLKSLERKFEKLRVHGLKEADRKEIEEIMTENYTSLEIIEII